MASSSNNNKKKSVCLRPHDRSENFNDVRFILRNIQGVIESCTDILTTSHWLHVELGKNI
jgi:hypothetical protein